MTNEQILYNFHLKNNIKSRNEAIELLKKRDFTKLNRNYINWFDKKEKIVELKSSLLSNVIKELSKIKIKDNESEPNLYTISKEEEKGYGVNFENEMVLSSYLYTIVPFEKCKISAKYNTQTAIWKIKHQPNGRDTKSYLEIINKFRKNKS